MKLETRSLSEHVGVEVLGFDPTAPIDADARAGLERIFIANGS